MNAGYEYISWQPIPIAWVRCSMRPAALSGIQLCCDQRSEHGLIGIRGGISFLHAVNHEDGIVFVLDISFKEYNFLAAFDSARKLYHSVTIIVGSGGALDALDALDALESGCFGAVGSSLFN